MKIRNGFVSNSSSSSFICFSTNNNFKFDRLSTDGEPDFETDTLSINIDDLINELQKAKETGSTVVYITYGGGYDG